MYMKLKDLSDEEELKQKGNNNYCSYVSESEMVLHSKRNL